MNLPLLDRARIAEPPQGSGLKQVPGRAAGIPFVGETLTYVRDPDAYFQQVYEEDGPVTWRRGLGMNIVALLGPDAWGVVHANRDRAFSHASGWDLTLGRFFHGAVMLTDFEEHLHQRRILQAAFGPTQLAGYLDHMNQTIEESLRGWRAGPRFRVAPALTDLTLNVASRTFMDQELGRTASRQHEAFKDILSAISAVVRFRLPGARLRLPGTEWARGVEGRNFLAEEIRRLLPSRRGGQGDDLLSVLCRATAEDGSAFTEDEIVDQMVFMLFAAHDTSTSAMTTMVYHLAKNPDWQQRCRDESLALGDHVTYDQVQNLESLDLVMKEALRLTSPLRQMFRATLKDTEVLGHFLPAGTVVMVAPHFNHHMPEYWTDPSRFDPERFSPERREDKSHRYAYVPFGSHAHKCIGTYFAGMEIKATLHQVLRTFEWAVPDGYEARWAPAALPRLADGLPLQIERT